MQFLPFATSLYLLAVVKEPSNKHLLINCTVNAENTHTEAMKISPFFLTKVSETFPSVFRKFSEVSLNQLSTFSSEIFSIAF